MKIISLLTSIAWITCQVHGAAIPVSSLEHSKEEGTEPPVDTNHIENSVKDLNEPELEPKLNPYADAKPSETLRQGRMLDYFGYYGPPLIPAPFFIPTPYAAFDYQPYGEDLPDPEDMMSRANHRRRPTSPGSTPYQNSQIFYIRLPPTPYMFVPGMGYVSQPPSFNPLPALPPIRPALPAVAVSPFINLPLNFVSNGRPTNVYQFNSDPRPPHYPTAPYYPTNRPHRPYYGNKPHYADSKITNLKGTFNFNGRPDNIYVLPNSIDPVYSNRGTPYY